MGGSGRRRRPEEDGSVGRAGVWGGLQQRGW